MKARLILAFLCLIVAAAVMPLRARAIDYNVAGSAQLDYHFVPNPPPDLMPPTQLLNGFTQEVSVKLAVDFSSHVSANVKVCWGCHGFELAMGFADLRIADELNIRAGRFIPTFGEFQLRHDVANHRTSDRPLPYDMGRMPYLTYFNRSVLPLPYVETGVEISGSHFFGNRVQIDYAAHLVSGLRSNASAPYDVDFAAMHSAAPYYIDNNSRPSGGGRLGATIRLGERVDLTIGGSGIYGTYDPEGLLRYFILGTDLFLRLGRTNIRAEYLLRRTEMSAQNQYEFPLARTAGGGFETPFMVKDGWYIELEQPINRAVEIVLRWDGLHRIGNQAPLAPLDFDAGISRWTLGANFVIERGYRIKASSEYYSFWGIRSGATQALGFHLSAVAAF